MNFDLDDAYRKLVKSPEKIKAVEDNAIKRLERYASTHCMKCLSVLTSLEDESAVKSSNEEHNRIKVQLTSEDTRMKTSVDHLLCKKCTEKILRKDSELKSLGANVNIPPVFKLIECKICEEEHRVDIKDWNNLFKKGCCSSCLIY